LGVAHPEDGVECKDLAGSERTLQLLDEVVVPGHGLGLSVCRAPRRLSSVGVAGNDHQANGLEGIGNDRSLRRADDVELLGDDQHDNADAEHEEAHEVSGPEALVLLHEGRSEERKTSDVDAGVEHHVDPLECNRGVDNNTLASLGVRRQSHLFAGVLVGDERCDVRLDTTSSETDDDDCCNIATKSSTVLNRYGQGGCPEDHETLRDMSVLDGRERLSVTETLGQNSAILAVVCPLWIVP